MLRRYSGSIQSSAVTIEIGGEFTNLTVSFDEGAVTGSIAIEYRAKGAAEFSVPADNVITLGANSAFKLIGGDIDAVRLTPSALSGAVTWRLAVWN